MMDQRFQRRSSPLHLTDPARHAQRQAGRDALPAAQGVGAGAGVSDSGRASRL